MRLQSFKTSIVDAAGGMGADALEDILNGSAAALLKLVVLLSSSQITAPADVTASAANYPSPSSTMPTAP